MVQKGADPQITNKKFETALSIADDNNDEDITELLAPHTQEIIRQTTLKPTTNGESLPTTDIPENQSSSARYHDMAAEILRGDDSIRSKATVKTKPSPPKKGYFYNNQSFRVSHFLYKI